LDFFHQTQPPQTNSRARQIKGFGEKSQRNKLTTPNLKMTQKVAKNGNAAKPTILSRNVAKHQLILLLNQAKPARGHRRHLLY